MARVRNKGSTGTEFVELKSERPRKPGLLDLDLTWISGENS